MSRPPQIEAAGRAIVTRLRDAGHEALWAGGCVRDRLLGRAPSDIDIATSATPKQIIALFRKTRPVGVQFGVVLVKEEGRWIEVATFRRDVNYQDGRRPEQVVFTDAREDALRRDFTINGLFYDPLAEQVIDYVHGQQDLQDRLVRAIGDPADRFAEDHLRMLRAARFAARLDFQIEPATAESIRAHALHLARISPERIREELEKMLIHPSRGRAVALMGELGLLPFLWPGADWPAARVQRACRVLAALPAHSGFELGMAALLNDRQTGEAWAATRALRCSNREVERVAWLVATQPVVGRAHQLSLAEARKLRAHKGFDDLLVLHQAVGAVDGAPMTGHEAAVRLRDAMTPEQAAPPPLVTGDDLIHLGISPGPAFKKILDQLYDAQLNNQITDRQDALDRARELMGWRRQPPGAD